MIKILWFVTVATGSWITLCDSSTPVNSYNTQAHPPSVPATLWCVADGVYWMSAQQMWKFEYHSSRWLWMPDPPADMVVRAHWNVGDTLYVLTERLFRYDSNKRAWLPVDSQNASPAVSTTTTAVVTWTDVENELLYLFTAQGFVQFELARGIWVNIEPHLNVVSPFVGSNGILYTGDEVRRWDIHKGWITTQLTEALPELIQLWRVGERTAYGITKMGEMWQLDVYTGKTQSMGTQDFPNRSNFSACTADMVVFGGVPNYNDLVRFGTVPKSLLDYGPILIVSGITLATSTLCFIILVVLCSVICYQQWYRKRTQLGPFVTGPQNVDFL